MPLTVAKARKVFRRALRELPADISVCVSIGGLSTDVERVETIDTEQRGQVVSIRVPRPPVTYSDN